MACLGVAAALLLFCSCWSFNIADKPSPYVYPPNDPAANWCGPTGAFFAYYLLYYIGQGVFILLATAACFLIASLRGQSVNQPVLAFHRPWTFVLGVFGELFSPLAAHGKRLSDG